MRLVSGLPWLLLPLLLLVARTAAGADEPGASAEAGEAVTPAGDGRARAHELFRESAEHYRAGRFEQAVALLRQAYELARQPVLLYNLGRAYEGNGQLDEAVAAYRRYLEQEPEVADRGAIERRIETLRRQIEERQELARQAAAARAERDRAAAERQQADGPSPAPWIVAGVGAAGAVAGVAFGALASGREQDAAADPVHASASETLDEAEAFATAANVFVIAGSAVAAIGLTWGIVDWATSGEPEAQPRVEVGLSPSGAMLRVPLPW